MLPAPVAVMQARHIAAARMHLASAHGLAADHGAPGTAERHTRHTERGALDTAYARIHEPLWDLQQYAERSALASGAIVALPELMKPNDPADQALYPSMHLGVAVVSAEFRADLGVVAGQWVRDVPGPMRLVSSRIAWGEGLK
ncbi:hypothetical protein [Nocardia africana]|uniref:Uncharacterized protein n=1 Tax=Nocardia africana TaxID=134964 RepID=A0A379X5U4_9NOCA|nr:hypothetical protein [Nocardia africana]SUH71848.1 Uncharacterised protein [Nocardia africana]